MSTWHPSSPPPCAAITPPIPNNIDEDGHHDLETVVLPSGEAEPAAPTEFGASTPPQHTSRRRGYTQDGPVLTCIFASDRDFTANGNGEGGAAQARHVDGDAHVTIDVTALRQAAALSPAPTETAESASVTNTELGTILSSFFRCVDGGPARYILTVRGTDNVGGEPNNKTSHSAAKYAKLLLSLFGVCLSACSAAFPIIKQGAPDEYVVLAYGLLAVLALVLLAGLLATSFDKSPSSVVWGKYALQLSLGLTIGFLTWSVCSLSPSHELSVPVGVAGALVYIIVVILFHCRNW